jgi:hypothetical protein
MKKTVIKSKIEGLENLEEHDIETLTDMVKKSLMAYYGKTYAA